MNAPMFAVDAAGISAWAAGRVVLTRLGSTTAREAVDLGLNSSRYKLSAPTITGYETANGTVRAFTVVESTVLNNANFAQRTFKSTFSAEGKFAGRPVADVADDLLASRLSPTDVPIEYILRDGNTLILNTRSAQALKQAGIPRSQWNAINMTGDAAAEARLSGQLQRNKLTSQGVATVRPGRGN